MTSRCRQRVRNLRLLEDEQREAQLAHARWVGKAAAASHRAEELPTEGKRLGVWPRSPPPAAQLENHLSTFKTQIEQHTTLTDRLKGGLNKMPTSTTSWG